MHETRDGHGIRFVAALLFATVISCLVIYNLWSGTVWGPGPKGARRFIIPQAYNDPLVVGGFVALKCSFIIWLFARYWLANLPQYDRWVVPCQLLALAAGTVGLALLLIFVAPVFA